MRITGGEHRGRILQAPKGDAVRPTSDKIRQAIFNILIKYGLPADAHVLDMFAGTGALGLEALSRGASSCVFFDKIRAHLDCARTNAETVNAGNAQFLLRDATKPGPRLPDQAQADLVFIDPPYRQGLITPVLAALVAEGPENGWLAPSAIAVLESEREDLDDVLSALPFALLDSRPYGDTLIRMIRYTTGS